VTKWTLVPVLALLVSRGVGLASDWPQFLGPGRDGRSPDRELVPAWVEGGLEECWRVAVGEGYSGIVAADGRVYSMDTDGRQEFAFARRAADGREIWRRRTGRSPRNNYGGHGPRSTPLVDGDEVLLVSAEGTLFALNATDGSVRWKRDLAAELGWRPPAEGTASSPLVHDGRIYILNGGGPGRGLVALERATGRTVWASQDDRTSYSSPIFWSYRGTRQVLFLTGTRLVSVSPATGAPLWSYEWRTYDRVNVATPIRLGSDRIFISSGYDQGAAVVGLERTPRGTEARERWRNREMKNHFNNSVYHDGVLFGFDNAILKAVSATTGDTLWRERGFGKGSLVLAAGHLIVLSDRGELALAEARRDALVVRRRKPVLEGRTWTPPTVAFGRLFLRSPSEMVCLAPAAAIEGEGGGRDEHR
jgi:outer membrane protein assembly factor BamB